MHFNLLYFPTLAIGVVLFWLGVGVARKITSGRSFILWGLVSIVVALPALLFVAYYGHLLANAAWFYTFRSLPYTELTASGLGLSAGIFAGWLHRNGIQKTSGAFRGSLLSLDLLILAALLFIPYAKPVIAPIRVPLQDRWTEGVCLQSTPSTCGPSSAATILHHLGLPGSEQELARECFSYGGGTENWYIARALQRRGLNTHYVVSATQPNEIPFPSIAGTEYGGQGGSGHFVAILGRENEQYIIGDPLVGKERLTMKELHSQYYLTGFFLVVSKGRPL